MTMAAGGQNGCVLASNQVKEIGTLLLNTLLQLKHNGATDIAREGLCSVVKRYVCPVMGQSLCLAAELS